MAGIVGSINIELERSYHIMLLKVANELTIDNCQQIAFVAGLPSPTVHPEPGKPDLRLHLMSTLESRGHIGPLKLDFLESVVDAIGKSNLLDIVQGYKKNSSYKEAMRRLDKHDEKKKKGERSGKQQASTVDHSLELMVKNSMVQESIRKLQESYATLLTQFSQVALLMRNALESEDQAQIERTFLMVAADGDAIARTLRKNVEDAGVLKYSDKESSGNDSQDNSPTDEDPKKLEASFSPPPPARVESLNPEHHSLTPESSPSPTPPRKPTPLPRKKRVPTQISSPCSSVTSATYTSSTPHQFVFCQQETREISLLAVALFHIPQSASTSCLTANTDYSGDYFGGTGDSGVGDIRHKYTPSQEALDQLDPVRRQQSRQDHHKEDSSSTGERSRYMKLKTKEEQYSDGYTKPLRARSLDDVTNILYAVQNEDKMKHPGKTMLRWKSPPPVPVFDFGHAFLRDNHTKQPPNKDTLVLVQSPRASRSVGHAVQRDDHTKQPPDKDSLVQNPRVLRSISNIGHTVQKDDHVKQPPDKDTPIWNPRAQGSTFLYSHIDLLPRTSDMAHAYSSLPMYTTVPIASGLCLAYFLASHPGLWPWSRGEI